MISNILKLIGVICAALIIGYIVGIREHANNSGSKVTSSDRQINETEKSTTTTETTERPDGSKITRTIIDRTKNRKTNEKKEDKITVKAPLNKNRIQVAVRPEWNKEKKEIKGHPVIGIGHRIWDSPGWVEVGFDVDRKEVTLGVALEW